MRADAYLRGQLTIAGATASLLGDSLLRPGAAGAEIAISSAPHFIAFSDAVAHGDAQGIASSIGELAADYYMPQTVSIRASTARSASGSPT